MGNRVQYGLKGKWTRRHKSVAISKKLFVFNVRTFMTFAYIYATKTQPPPAAKIFFSASLLKYLAFTTIGAFGIRPLPNTLKYPFYHL